MARVNEPGLRSHPARRSRLAGLELLERIGPEQSTTTRFHYAIGGRPAGTRQRPPHNWQGVVAGRCTWLFRQLRAVPRCDDPHGRTLDSVEEPVGPDDDLAIGQIRKLRDDATGFGKLLQPAQGVVGSLPERRCGLGVLTSDICESRKKLGACGRREANPQEGSSPTRSLASASTSSRSCPTLAAISCSPRTRSRSSSRSCSPCS